MEREEKTEYGEQCKRVLDLLEKYNSETDESKKQEIQDEYVAEGKKLRAMNGNVQVLDTHPDQTHEVIDTKKETKKDEAKKPWERRKVESKK